MNIVKALTTIQTILNRNAQRIARGLTCVLGVTLLSGCWKTISFEEEVQLRDDRVIRIERSDKLGTDCPEMRCGSKLNSAIIKTPNASSEWRYKLVPIILDEMDDALSIIASPISDTDTDGDSRKWPTYVQFNFTSKGWVRGCLNKKFIGRKANLLLSINWNSGEPKPVSLAEKEIRNRLSGVLAQQKEVLPQFVSLPCKTPN